MAGIILSQAVQIGIQDVAEKKMNESEAYKKLVEEADQKIEESRHRYATAYKKQHYIYLAKTKRGFASPLFLLLYLLYFFIVS